MTVGELRIAFCIAEHWDDEEGFGYLAWQVDDAGARYVGWSTAFDSVLGAIVYRAEQARREGEPVVAVGLGRGTYPVKEDLPQPVAEGRVVLVSLEEDEDGEGGPISSANARRHPAGGVGKAPAEESEEEPSSEGLAEEEQEE